MGIKNRLPDNLSKRRHRLVRLVGAVGLCIALTFGLPALLRWWTDARYKSSIFDVDDVPNRRVAIVFGAGVWPSGQLSAVLEDRMETAINLYNQGKVEKLLLTGDNSTIHYNEPGHMRQYALENGVPYTDIILDYAGRRTYDSCYRAKHIFCVDEAIVVTQAYHIDRALFTANSLGIDAVGVAADQRDYHYIQQYWWREVLATSLAWWQVTVSRPEPIMGDKLPIFPD